MPEYLNAEVDGESELWVAFQEYQERGGFQSKSEAVRAAVRRGVMSAPLSWLERQLLNTAATGGMVATLAVATLLFLLSTPGNATAVLLALSVAAGGVSVVALSLGAFAVVSDRPLRTLAKTRIRHGGMVQ